MPKRSILIFGAALISSAALAQSPPPISDPVPITVDVATQTALIDHLRKAPWEYANPVIVTIQRLQEEAQRKAVTDRVRAMTTKPAEAK